MPSLRTKRSHPTWIGIALAFYAFITIGMAEGGLGVLLPSIQATYSLTTASVTLLFLSQVTGFIVSALFSSLLSDRIGLAKMLLLASSALTGALCLYALSPSWAVMVLVGTMSGLGIGLIDAGVNTYIADDQENAHLMGILHAFYGIGSLLGPAIATTLLSFGFSWRIVYLILASAAGLMAVGMLWAVVSRYQLMKLKAATSEDSPNADFRTVFKMPVVLIAGLLLLIYVGIETSLSDWSYSVQALSRGTPAAIAGYSVSAYWLGLTIGRFGMGQMVAKLGALRTLNFNLALLVTGTVLWWLIPQPLPSLFIIGFALGPIFPITIWLMPRRVAAAAVPSAIGFMTSAGSMGAALVPTMMGWSANRAGLGVIPLLIVVLTILMVGLHRWLLQHTPTHIAET